MALLAGALIGSGRPALAGAAGLRYRPFAVRGVVMRDTSAGYRSSAQEPGTVTDKRFHPERKVALPGPPA